MRARPISTVFLSIRQQLPAEKGHVPMLLAKNVLINTEITKSSSYFHFTMLRSLTTCTLDTVRTKETYESPGSKDSAITRQICSVEVCYKNVNQGLSSLVEPQSELTPKPKSKLKLSKLVLKLNQRCELSQLSPH